MNKKINYFIKRLGLFSTLTIPFFAWSCIKNEPKKTEIPKSDSLEILESIESNSSTKKDQSVFYLKTKNSLDLNQEYIIVLDDFELPIKIKESIFENQYFAYSKNIESKEYEFKYIKFNDKKITLPNQKTTKIIVHGFAEVIDPKLDFVEEENPIWDELSIDINLNRVQNYSFDEERKLPWNNQLVKLKKLKNWGDPYFGKIIKEKNLINLSYEDEVQNLEYIAPFKNINNSNVMYQLTVYSFADGNNDGIGDFIGLKYKLDYFVNLGIDTLYLSPIHPASSYHGYDVIDYTDVAPELGGLQAFEEFIKEAHSKGIKVVIDMVLNHTSYEHPWFQQALAGNKEFQDYYYFYENDGQKRNKEGQDNIRQYFRNVYDFINTKNNPIPTTLKWVAEFWSGMPDLNLNNPKVLQELDYIHQFWATKGVDGFRYDAFEHYFKSENSKKFNTNDPEKTRNLFNRWRNVVENTYKKANENNINRTDLRTLLFGEWWRDPAEPIIKDYWGENNGISSVIDGTKWKGITNVSLNWNDEINVINSLTRDGFKHEWMPFLDNHDVERWINNFKKEFNIPITVSPHKLSDLEVSAYEYAMFSLLSRGGLPILYNGNELLMQGAMKSPDTNVREAYNWKDLRRRVFFADTRDNSNVISTKASSGQGTIEDIINDENSSYHKISKLINLRKKYKSMREMDVKYVTNPNNILWIWNDETKKLYESELTVRKNDDGTYLLIIYSWGNRPIANLSIKNEFEITETLFEENLKIVEPNPGDVQIHGTGISRLGIYLISPKTSS